MPEKLTMKIQSLAGRWKFRQAGAQEWYPAEVPGGVHTDLLALGMIPDPFVGDNEKRVQWVAEQDWEYLLQFMAEPELMHKQHVYMVCDGLDTLAEVNLNGYPLGSTINMFRQYRWDVKDLIRAGENELLIAFSSPVRYITEKQAVRPMQGVSQAIQGGPHLRKAPCQFGWDWGPQLPPIGIWKDIRLEGYDAARIDDVRFSQENSDGQAAVEARITPEVWDDLPCSAILRLVAPDGQVLEATTPMAPSAGGVLRIIIPNPQLWWPNGYGLQPLYKAIVELRRDDKILDRREVQLGLRTIELRQQPDEWGRSFTFVVNGLPIFARGSNWIPADSFPTRISDRSLEGLIRSAAETHQNMLRVWGGGLYEEERFYDLCDRYGILVWQEFIFSCSIYPLDDPVFLENVHMEVIDNVRRLRHRASLALWCGNNEMEWEWERDWTAPEYAELKAAYDQFFHHTLAEWCTREDPNHAYWPSSPSSDTPFENPNGEQQGDAHYWDVWHKRKPFTAYRTQYPRFMSEFGFQALPPIQTVKTYADEEDWNITSYIMERHQKNDSGNQLMVSQMLDTFRLPKDFESLVYLSLVLQAEGIRYGVEHWRRHEERISGVLYWQLNDCWPVASWSSLDYFGRWKALHYAARRFYAPLLLSIKDEPTGQELFLTNDTREPWEGSVRWSLEKLDGSVLEVGEVYASAQPFMGARICHLDFSALLDDELRRNCVFVADLWQKNELVSRQTAYFVPTKHLELAAPSISAKVRLEDGQIRIELTSRSLARLVECTLEGFDGVFSDNYFDLPAGRTVDISAAIPASWTTAQVVKALKVRSIYDSYAHKETKS